MDVKLSKVLDKGVQVVGVIERGGKPWDGKNFDLYPPPGREFRPEGKSVLYGRVDAQRQQ